MPGAERVHVGVALLEEARLCVMNAVMQRGTAEGLGLDHDAPQLSGLEAALLLDGAEQLLAMEVPVAEVPAEDEAGDDLAVDPFVVVEVAAAWPSGWRSRGRARGGA